MKTLTFTQQVYPCHIDFMRHVSNITFIEWMEVGRCKLLDAVGMPVTEIAEQGFGPVLVRTEIDYKQQLFLGEEVHISLWISEMTRVTAWMNFEFRNQNEELIARGKQRGLFISFDTHRPRALSEQEYDQFAEYLHAS